MDHPEYDKPAARRVEAREFREDMAEFLHQAEEGASFLITSYDR